MFCFLPYTFYVTSIILFKAMLYSQEVMLIKNKICQQAAAKSNQSICVCVKQ